MIVDLERFIRRERPLWEELDAVLSRIESEPVWRGSRRGGAPGASARLNLEQARRLHYLYERAAAGLARIQTFSSDPDAVAYLESLVARAYAVIHALERAPRRLAPLEWFFRTLPRTFRRHLGAFVLSASVMLAGAIFGGVAVAFDPDAKAVIMPFPGLLQDPSERVRQEERAGREDRLAGGKTAFASLLMTHNTRVSVLVLALGLTWGVGTVVLLFYNGVLLGAVVVDYVRAGESAFLAGWLLPHGSVEIPAVLLAGQAGLVLASALLGRGERTPLKLRLRQVGPSLVTLIFGVAILLVWAGIVEAFLSQYHWPVLPYGLKIALGCVELALLAAFLGLSGRGGGRRTGESETAAGGGGH